MNIHETLLHIRNSPGCDSEGLDGFLLEDLHERGLIKGKAFTSLKSGIPRFQGLRLTVDGEAALASASAPPIEPTAASWYANPFLVALLGVVGTVLAAGAIYYLGWS